MRRVRNFCGVEPIQVMVSVHESSNLVTANYKPSSNCAVNVPALDDNAGSQFLSFKPN